MYASGLRVRPDVVSGAVFRVVVLLFATPHGVVRGRAIPGNTRDGRWVRQRHLLTSVVVRWACPGRYRGVTGHPNKGLDNVACPVALEHSLPHANHQRCTLNHRVWRSGTNTQYGQVHTTLLQR